MLFTYPVIAKGIIAPMIFAASFLPSREMLPQVSIATAIAKFYPLPEEELMTAYNRGNTYLMEAKFQEALQEFNRAVDLDPSKADVYLSRGIAKEKLLYWEDAIDDYRKANDIFKKRPFSNDDPTAISNIANAETGLNQWENALRDFTQAASLKSDYLAPQIGKALVLYQLDRRDESFAFFKSLVSKYPNYADGNAALAVLYNEKGDFQSASDYWESALEGDSRYEDLDWVLNVRRWPPKLVTSLEKFKKEFSLSLVK